jgi:RimJ/RimL family protein N-acetyltransferase
MTLLIRPFTASDRTSLSSAIDDVCRDCSWMSTTRFEPTPAWEYAFIHPNCESHRLFVAKSPDRIVGWCRLFPVDSGQRPGQYELGIGLLKEYRYQGWGTALLDWTLKMTTNIGRIRLMLTVHRENEVACRLFIRYGFKVVGPARADSVAMTWHYACNRTTDQRRLLDAREGNERCPTLI